MLKIHNIQSLFLRAKLPGFIKFWCPTFCPQTPVAVTYIGDIFDKTATYCSVTATDWLSLTAMSFAFGYIAKREKKAASQN